MVYNVSSMKRIDMSFAQDDVVADRRMDEVNLTERVKRDISIGLIGYAFPGTSCARLQKCRLAKTGRRNELSRNGRGA